MIVKPYVMLAGPTMVPERVIMAMNRQVINHRGQAFESMMADIVSGLKSVFQTSGDILIYPSSGSGAMEAAVANFIIPGSKVLSFSTGVFGDRFAEMAKRFGAEIIKVDSEWGQSADINKARKLLADDKNQEIKAILCTHNETSTAVTNDIKALSAVREKHPALMIVDAVSSLGALPLYMDEWNLDVVVSGSQKAMMMPPGLGFLAVGTKAWTVYEKSTGEKWYWDAKMAQKAMLKNQTPYTPAVSLLFGLQEALKMIAEEGLENIYRRHELLGDMARAGLEKMGLKLFAGKEAVSNCVTAVWGPEGIEAKRVQKLLREKYGITTAGGQKELEGKIFRIGHLGYVAPSDLLLTLASLEMALTELGLKVELGKGVSAAQEVMLKA